MHVCTVPKYACYVSISIPSTTNTVVHIRWHVACLSPSNPHPHQPISVRVCRRDTDRNGRGFSFPAPSFRERGEEKGSVCLVSLCASRIPRQPWIPAICPRGIDGVCGSQGDKLAPSSILSSCLVWVGIPGWDGEGGTWLLGSMAWERVWVFGTLIGVYFRSGSLVRNRHGRLDGRGELGIESGSVAMGLSGSYFKNGTMWEPHMSPLRFRKRACLPK
ncbi:hypothetical protein M432DRAFT_164229 [Thermoascus aurantiacus ATCC 26904]